jgi:hypothetical protein
LGFECVKGEGGHGDREQGLVERVVL